VQHAAPETSLALWGRNSKKLQATAKIVRDRGARVLVTSLDLTCTNAAIAALAEQDEEECFDIAYLAAGIGETRQPGDMVECPEIVLQTALTNFAAPACMAAALAARMADRGRGRIVLIGSAAGHHSLPFASSYSGSKAGLARFSDSLRLAVKPYGVSITLAAPGFLDTNGRNEGPVQPPFMLPVDEAARRIVRAGRKGVRHYVTPYQFRLLRALDIALPDWLRERLFKILEM
jgi:short-subunit dehydrogenase